ncbi:MAG TPA: dockerin type I domain-containing protein [Anaerohalosphaeraceae bacterium]|nr:dockerin type I domain-containing protein [Anaerohalosphaeraceae bacterium]
MKDWTITIILSISSSVLAMQGDFNGDDVVNLSDLSLLTADWLSDNPQTPAVDMDEDGRVNYLDFRLFASAWRSGHVNRPPIAFDVEYNCVAGGQVEVLLSGTDDIDNPLTFRLLDSPLYGHLSKRGEGRYVYYARRQIGKEEVRYVSNDGTFDSNPARLVINVLPKTIDTLYLSGGAVRVYDGQSFALDSSFTLSFWFRSRYDTGVIASKRSADKGLLLLLFDGRPILRLYEATGVYHQILLKTRIDTGEWVMLTVSHNSEGGVVTNGDPNITTVFISSPWPIGRVPEEAGLILPNLDIANAADLLFFSGYRNWTHWGQIDAVNYCDSALNTFSVSLVYLEGRTQNTHSLSPTYAIRFPVNEGSGSQIRSTDEEYDGMIYPDYLWAPADSLLYAPIEYRLRSRGIKGSFMRQK